MGEDGGLQRGIIIEVFWCDETVLYPKCNDSSIIYICVKVYKYCTSK